VKRRHWAVVLALAIIASGACVAETREPWMVLVADGAEYDGLLISYCWSELMAGVCADGMMREPPVHVIRTSGTVLTQIRTRGGLTELNVRISPDWRSGAFTAVHPARADALRLQVGTHYLAISARWPRGDGLFLFGLSVEKP
jgi:hypothetical protein